MSRSGYYGMRGDTVRQMQRELNKKGARLKIDGVWGEQTESAYQSMGGGISSASKNAGGVQMLNFKTDNDDGIRKRASDAISGEYEAQMMAEQKRADSLMRAIEDAITKLHPQYEQRLDLLEKNYGIAREGVDNEMIKRGMQRSSHYIDSISQSHSEQHQQRENIMNLYQEELADLNRELRSVEGDLEINRGMISAKRESAMYQYIDKLTEQRDKKLMDMIKYNNSILLQQQKANASTLKSSRTSSSKSKNTATVSNYKSILQEWNSLTDTGKVQFFDHYGEEVKKQDKNAYVLLKMEMDKIRNKGLVGRASLPMLYG